MSFSRIFLEEKTKMKKRIIFSGSRTEKEKLFDVLNQMSDTTVIDSIVRNKEKISLEIGRTGEWEIKKDMDAYESDLNSKGSNFNSLIKYLDQMYEEKELSYKQDISLVVLSYAETLPTKTWEGLIKSLWFEIDPAQPYTVNDGNVQLKTREIVSSEADYKLLMECKIAIAVKDKIYPFTMASLKSIGRYLDCESAFKKVDEYSLGNAIQVANKLSYLKQIRILAYKRPSNIWPIRTLCGRQYVYIPQSRFFEKFFDKCSAYGVYQIRSWMVNDDITQVDVKFSGSNRCMLVFNSDIASSSITFIAYELVCGVRVKVRKMSFKHTSDLDDINMDEVLKSMFAGFCEVEDKLISLKNKHITYDLDIYEKLKVILGKKRCKNIEFKSAVMENAYEAYCDILKNTFHELPKKQSLELQEEYASLLDYFFQRGV